LYFEAFGFSTWDQSVFQASSKKEFITPGVWVMKELSVDEQELRKEDE